MAGGASDAIQRGEGRMIITADALESIAIGAGILGTGGGGNPY